VANSYQQYQLRHQLRRDGGNTAQSPWGQNPWEQTRQQPLSDVGHLDPPYYEPRVLQPPLNLASDDSGDAATIDATSNSSSTADSVCSFESTRDIHEFIREFNGRSYNALNTVYFLPAGQSEFESFILQPYVCILILPHPLDAFSQKGLSLTTLPLVRR